MPRSFVLPGQPARYARDHPFQITHSKIEIQPDFDTKSIKGKVLHKVTAVGEPIRSVTLDAVDLNILGVSVDGKNASFQAVPKVLKIELGRYLRPDENVDIEIEYSATPSKGLYFRGPTKNFPNRFVHLFTQGEGEDNRYWFPCYDYPNMRSTTEMLVRAPSKMTVVSNGRLLSVKELDGGLKLWHFSQEVAHSSYLTSLVVGEYERIAVPHDGISVEYYVPGYSVKDAERSFGKTPKMMDFFSKVTGQKYPYPKYAQSVVSDFMFGGMENISATTLTDLTLHDERAHMDFQSDNLVGHEFAHQWFGDYLTCKDWSHAWLNEAFATYFNALFREHDEGWDDFQYTMNASFERVSDEIKDHYQRQIVEKRYWDGDEIFDSITYEGGSWVLNGLRGLLGDDVFWKGIQHYVATHRSSLVETSDFRKSMERVSGLNLERFFEEWLYSPGFPEYDALYSFDDKSNLAEITIEQTNAGGEGVPLFSNPIEILLTFQDGSKQLHSVNMAEKKSSFFFYIPSQPLNVNIDPKNWILKKLKFHKPKEMLLYQLKNDENAMERIRAAEELGSEYKTDDVVQALAESIESDRFWGVKLESAKYLGKMGTSKALQTLLYKKSHSDHRARRGVAIGLRWFADLGEESKSAVDALVDFLDNDASYYVRAFAAHSLGFYKKSQRAYDALETALEQDSVNDQVRYRAFLGFAEMKDPKVIPLAKDYLENGKWYQGKVGAIDSIGSSGKGNPEALKVLLSTRDLSDVRVKTEAANTIAKLEDSGAVPELEAWLSFEPEGRVRRALRETIYSLKENVTRSEREVALEKQVNEVLEEAKKLKEKLEALETRTAETTSH